MPIKESNGKEEVLEEVDSDDEAEIGDVILDVENDDLDMTVKNKIEHDKYDYKEIIFLLLLETKSGRVSVDRLPKFITKNKLKLSPICVSLGAKESSEIQGSHSESAEGIRCLCNWYGLDRSGASLRIELKIESFYNFENYIVKFPQIHSYMMEKNPS
ncbi:hypothetical protein JTB14_006467 [Gonioctena quinquepunctata]|nr:hypothetical protein JTB14_006467 [Gonioctena quinquepunctata]